MSLNVGTKKYCAVAEEGINNQDIVITHNGNYTPDANYTGFGVVRVNVPEPSYSQLTITPSIEQQQFIPSDDGFSKVTVDAVTSDIDANIIASNIKKGIKILGVTGSYEFFTETLEVDPTQELQEIYPNKDGFSKVTIRPVNATIDANLVAGNIKKDVEILGIVGTVVESNNINTRNITSNGVFAAEAPYTGFSSVVVDVKPELQDLTIHPKTELQTFGVADEYTGFSSVRVNPVTNDIDANIIPQNIRQGITILGVEGTIGYEEVVITPTSQRQEFVPESGSYSKVIVEPAMPQIDENISAENIKKDVTILGVTGTYEFVGEEITVTQGGEYAASEGFDGISKVIVDVSAYEQRIKDLEDQLQELEAQLQALNATLISIVAGE